MRERLGGTAPAGPLELEVDHAVTDVSHGDVAAVSAEAAAHHGEYRVHVRPHLRVGPLRPVRAHAVSLASLAFAARSMPTALAKLSPKIFRRTSSVIGG